MRLSCAALTLVIAGCAGTPSSSGDGADPLAALQARLRSAATVDVQARLASAGVTTSSLSARLTATGDGPLILDVEGTVRGTAVTGRLTSEGGRLFVDSGARHADRQASADFARELVVGLVHHGLSPAAVAAARGELPEGLDVAQLRDVVTGTAEGIEGRKLTPVRFPVKAAGGVRGEATLWLDVDTGLPVRRAQVVHLPEGEQRVVEEYDAFVVEP